MMLSDFSIAGFVPLSLLDFIFWGKGLFVWGCWSGPCREGVGTLPATLMPTHPGLGKGVSQATFLCWGAEAAPSSLPIPGSLGRWKWCQGTVVKVVATGQ